MGIGRRWVEGSDVVGGQDVREAEPRPKRTKGIFLVFLLLGNRL